MRTNTKATTPKVHTHEGAIVNQGTVLEQLKRSVMACMLWEDTFYEDGVSIADRIHTLAKQLPVETVCNLAIKARDKMKLRHAPLWLILSVLDRKGGRVVGDTISHIIQRPDELCELLALYWKDGRKPLAKQLKRGLAMAFSKFDEYQFAKYDRDSTIKLRDVLFMVHAKPTQEREDLYRRIVDRTLETPDTWEVALSTGGDKKDTFVRLIQEQKLGALAMLRNLRNMIEAKVPDEVIRQGLTTMRVDRVLPYRFIAAAKYAPRFEPELETAMFKCMEGMTKLPGKTLIVVDISGSMSMALSSKSVMVRAHAAGALAILARELCADPIIYATAGDDYQRKHATGLVPTRRGFGLSDAIFAMREKLGGGGIFLKQVMDYIAEHDGFVHVDRVIVITDEQDCGIGRADSPDKARTLGTTNYIINVGTDKNGVGYKTKWHKIDGWSESALAYIAAVEGISQEPCLDSWYPI